MNDIQRAMALLRGERTRQTQAPTPSGDRAHPEVVPGSGEDAAVGSARDAVKEAPERDAPYEHRPEGERRRFDDDLFAGDIVADSDYDDSAGRGVSGPGKLESADELFGDDASSRDVPDGTVLKKSTTGAAPAAGGVPSVASRATEERETYHDDPGATVDRNKNEQDPRRVIALPLRRLAAEGFITPGIVRGRLSEEFRRVKRPVLKNVTDAERTDGHRNVVMVTSSVAGEGKTYTAINLAMSLAMERDRTVLLVDADVIKGSAGGVLGIDGSRPGLTDLLANPDMDVAEVMVTTDVPDLRFLPAGRPDEYTTELLSSVRMSELIDDLARRYADRIILLDCPPMLQTNEANVIVDHAGQVVFVVAGEETDQRLVLEAMRRFDEDKSVGVLLNKASGMSAAYGYDYGYG